MKPHEIISGGETYVEGVHFDFFEEGKIKIPVAKLDHPIWLGERTVGIIHLESFNVKKNATEAGRDDVETKIPFRAAKDKDSGIWFGTVVGNEKDGRIKWKNIPLRMSNQFDLSKLSERRDWTAISRSPVVEGSPNQTGKPKYRVIDAEGQAANRLATYKEKDKAVAIVGSLNEFEMRDAGILLGINVKAFSPTSLIAEVRHLVENDYKKFLTIWEHPHRQINTEFIKAERLGVVTRSTDAGTIYYMFNGIKLGVSTLDCATFLASADNTRTFSDIVIANREAEKLTQHNYKVARTDIGAVDKEAELKKKIEALEKQLAEKKEHTHFTPQTKEHVFPVVDSLENMGDAGLKILGKKLKVPSYHVLGREKLIEGIKLKQA